MPLIDSSTASAANNDLDDSMTTGGEGGSPEGGGGGGDRGQGWIRVAGRSDGIYGRRGIIGAARRILIPVRMRIDRNAGRGECVLRRDAEL